MAVQFRTLRCFVALIALQIALVVLSSEAIHAQGSPGSLDPSFGGDGKVGKSCTFPLSATDSPAVPFAGTACNDSVNAMALESDGSFVLAGGNSDFGEGGGFKLWRYLADGSSRGTFALTDVTNGPDFATAIVIQSDGKIIAGGYAYQTGAFVLVRYLPDETLDASFGSGGIVQTPMGVDYAILEDLVILPDGKLLAAGEAKWFAEGSKHLALARYLPDGQLDTTFGRNGRAYARFFGNANISGLALAPDGKFVVSGYISGTTILDYWGFAIMRFLPNGLVDFSFGTLGRVVLRSPKLLAATSLVVQDDGKIVVGGVGEPEPGVSSFAVIRLTETGSLDPDFGQGGGVLTIFPEGDSRLNALALQSDGKLVAAGSVDVPAHSREDFAVVRYLPDGSLDLDFGMDGRVTTQFFASSPAEITAVLLQPDGKIVAAGTVFTWELFGPRSGTLPAMARYLP